MRAIALIDRDRGAFPLRGTKRMRPPYHEDGFGRKRVADQLFAAAFSGS
jgi:hypothetical protein